MAKVIVLYDGYSQQLQDTIMKANCSCTLIKAGDNNIIVDTMTAWDGERVLEALAKHSVKPEDINYVVCTHGHPDHTGNNNLFLAAMHIVGHSVHEDVFFYDKNLLNEDFHLCEGVKITATPGHTAEDVSVLVDAELHGETARVAITGDLFECERDIEDPSIWKEMGDPKLRELQATMRLKILEKSDYIVPGHGGMFQVTEAMRKKLRDQRLSQPRNSTTTS